MVCHSLVHLLPLNDKEDITCDTFFWRVFISATDMEVEIVLPFTNC